MPLLVAIFLCITPLGALSNSTSEEDAKTPGLNIVETAVSAGQFEGLVAALGAANLTELLKGDGPFTVFAPTDEAIEKLGIDNVQELFQPQNRRRLEQVLSFHVVSGRLSAGDLLSSRELSTLQGGNLNVRLEQGRLKVNDAFVTSNDIPAANGVIHAIDTVLLPELEEVRKVDSTQGTIDLLSLAIERGVPLYNSGQPLACVAVYEVALQSLVSRPGDLQEEVVAVAETAVDKFKSDESASTAAWTLRNGIDRVIELLLLKRRLSQASVDSANVGQRLFQFDDRNEVDAWFSLNDDVMGGISQSRMVASAPGIARFEGALSLENNGGFATVRSRAQELNLEGAEGLRFRVRGDGRTYRISALTSDRRREVRNWQCDFRTEAGTWQEFTIPFTDLELNVMGRRFPGAGPLSPSSVRSISFGIADKNETPFSLEIDWIEAIRVEPAI